MTSDNETVEYIIGEMHGSAGQRYCSSKHCSVKVYNPILDFADRIEAAHRREVAELTANLDALEKAMERVCSRDEVNEIIAIKKEIQNEGK